MNREIHGKSLAIAKQFDKTLLSSNFQPILQTHLCNWTLILVSALHRQMDSLTPMGLLPDTYNCGLRMRRGSRERFPRHRLQRKPLVRETGIHIGTCVTHVPWCISESLTAVAGKIFPAFPAHVQPAILRIWQEAHYNSSCMTLGASKTRIMWNKTSLVKKHLKQLWSNLQ